MPSAEVAAKLPPGLIALDRTLLASEAGLPDTLLNADMNNFSPRVGFAWRLDESNKTVLRGGFGLFHPTVAVQGIRDLLATNEFRYTTAYRGGGLRNGFSGGVPFTDPAAFGNQGIDPNLEAPDIYQYNLTVERELPGAMGLRVSYIGSTSRKLLNDVDFNTLAGQHRAVHQRRQSRGCGAAALRAVRLLHGHRRQPRRGPLRQPAVGAPAAVEGRLRGQRRLHAGAFRQQRARIRATARSDRSSSIRTTSRRTAAPIRTS